MKGANFFYGIIVWMWAYLCNIPVFDATIIPGWLSAPIPNPLFVFKPFTILFLIAGIILIASAFESEKPQTPKPKQK